MQLTAAPVTPPAEHAARRPAGAADAAEADAGAIRTGNKKSDSALLKGEENGFEIFRIPRIAWVPGLPGDARERRGALWTLWAIWVLWLFWISRKPEETRIIVPRFNGSVPLLRHAV